MFIVKRTIFTLVGGKNMKSKDDFWKKFGQTLPVSGTIFIIFVIFWSSIINDIIRSTLNELFAITMPVSIAGALIAISVYSAYESQTMVLELFPEDQDVAIDIIHRMLYEEDFFLEKETNGHILYKYHQSFNPFTQIFPKRTKIMLNKDSLQVLGPKYIVEKVDDVNPY